MHTSTTDAAAPDVAVASAGSATAVAVVNFWFSFFCYCFRITGTTGGTRSPAFSA